MEQPIADCDIVKLKDGDLKTWQRAKADFDRGMYSRARQLLQSTPHLRQLNAEDIVQETWLKAWNYRNSFRGSTRLELIKWMGVILKNTFLDCCRKKGTFSLTAPSEVTGPERTPSENVRFSEKTSQLETHLQRMDETSRRIVKLRNEKGMRFHEIARRLGMNVNTVSSTYRRAIRKLRIAMAKFESGSQSTVSSSPG